MNDNVVYTRHTPSFPLTHPVSFHWKLDKGQEKRLNTLLSTFFDEAILHLQMLHPTVEHGLVRDQA